MAQSSGQSWSERIRHLKQVLPIEVLIGQYFTLVPEGPRYLRAREHDSLVVDRRVGRYHWNARGESGDLVDFLCRQEGLTVPEALARLDAQHLVRTPSVPSPPASRGPTWTRNLGLPHDLLPVLRLAVRVYHAALLQDERARAYLAQRGIDEPTIHRLHLGFCRGSVLSHALDQAKVPRSDAFRAGLLTQRSRGPVSAPPSGRSDDREFFVGRIVVPEIGPLGPVWLIGRLLPGWAGPRYLGLPFPRPLLGYHRVRASPLVLVTEGVFDLLTLSTWNLPGVALCGTDPGPLAKAQLLKLARSKRLVLVPQADLPGQRAIDRLAMLLPDPPPIVRLPVGVKDLSELAEKVGGREAFLEALPNDVCQTLSRLPAAVQG